MRARDALALIVLASCGGSPKPERQAPVVSSKQTTRHVVEEEPEPTDGVSIVNERGRMDVDAISKSLAPHTASLSECYTTRVNKRRWLGGNVEISWDISRDGEITAVKLASSDLGSWPIEKCLIEIAASATFPKPTGGDADFQVPLNFSAKGAAMLWDETAGLRAVGGQVASLEACDKALLKRVADEAKAAKKAPRPKPGEVKKKHAPPSPPEDVTITLYVGPKGAAQSVGFSSKASVVDAEWGDCAEKAAMAWRLPDPRGQVAKLAVKYKPVASTGDE